MSDDLAPARGCLYGLAISVVIWVVIFLLIWLVLSLLD